MKKKSRKKKQFRKRRQQLDSSFEEYRELLSSLEGKSEEEALQYLRTKGEEFNRIFDASFRKLQEQLLLTDPLLLLSSLSFYNLSSLARRSNDLGGETPIQQHAIELIQALLLQHPRGAFSLNSRLSFDSKVLRGLIRETTQAFQTRRLARLDPSTSAGERVRLRVLEYMRIHTQVVRNWGYPQQITRIVKDLFAPFEDDIEQWRGVRISCLIDMFLKLAGVIANRMNAHNDLVRPMVRAKSINSAVKRYYQSFPDLESKPGDFIAMAKKRRVTLENVQSWLISHSTLCLTKIYTVRLDDFMESYPVSVDPKILRQVLDSWSFSFGDLSKLNSEHFFLENPIWNKPLIRVDKDIYFWPITGTVVSFCLQMMEHLIASNPDLQERYERFRGKFLEDEVERLFKSAFPDSKVYRGSLWRDSSTKKDFENDLLILIDSYIIVVECKSAKVHPSARRGADLRLQHIIDELIIEPSLQAQRFTDYLTKGRKIHRFPTKKGEVNEIDTSNVYEAVRININLDLLGLLMSRWPELRQAGFVSQSTRLSPTMSVADLEIVFALLNGTCQKLHYLIRRSQFEETAVCLGDEPDLLAFYIETGFNVGEAEFNGTPLILWGMSKFLDPYFMRQWWDEDAPKPRRQLTTWWLDILQRIEQRRVPRWTELGYILHNVAYDAQVGFEKGFKKVQNKVLRRWKSTGRQDFIRLLNGPPQRRDVIIGLAYKRLSKDERDRQMRAAAAESINDAKTNRALVICKDVEDGNYPYSIIGCLIKNPAATVAASGLES